MTTITVDFKQLGFSEAVSNPTATDRNLCLTLILEMFGIALFEFFNTSSGIDQFLFACKKGMAGRADFHLDL